MQIVLNIEDTVASTVEREARKEGLPLDIFIENLVETTFSPAAKKTELSHTTMIEALGNDELASYNFELSDRKGKKGRERKIDFS